MNKTFKTLASIFFGTFLLLPVLVFAHQPRIVDDNFVEIRNPEISQAFYGELNGTSTEYQIISDKEFKLYLGLLVPDIPNVNKDFFTEIYRVKDGDKEVLAVLDGSKFDWQPFYEEYGGDNYFWGPEFSSPESKKGVTLVGRLEPAGEYRVKISSPTNLGKYVLVVGYLEEFPPNEIFNALISIPWLKVNFFQNSFTKIITSPYIYGPIILLLVVIIIIRLIVRIIKKRNSKKYK